RVRRPMREDVRVVGRRAGQRKDLTSARVHGDDRALGDFLRRVADTQAVLVHVVQCPGEDVLRQALELRVKREHDVVTGLCGPEHVRRDLGAAVVYLDAPRSRVAEQGCLVRRLYPGDAHEVVYRVAGVVYGVGLLGVTNDLRREGRRVGAIDALPQVPVGAAGHALLDGRNESVGDVPGHYRAVHQFLGLAPVRRAQLRVDT